MLAAVLAAAYAPADSPYGLINGVHLLGSVNFPGRNRIASLPCLVLFLFSSHTGSHVFWDRALGLPYPRVCI